MSPSRVERIRTAIRLWQYDMSAHAMEEMAEDELNIEDVEQSVLNSRIVRTEYDDPRGTKYVFVGYGVDGTTQIGVVCRLTPAERCLIITVYEVTEP